MAGKSHGLRSDDGAITSFRDEQGDRNAESETSSVYFTRLILCLGTLPGRFKKELPSLEQIAKLRNIIQCSCESDGINTLILTNIFKSDVSPLSRHQKEIKQIFQVMYDQVHEYISMVS